MNWIKSLRYEAVFRYPNGQFCDRKMFNNNEKKRGFKLWNGKMYQFIPTCMSHSDRMGILGKIRSFDYTINDGIPYIFEEKERANTLSKENEFIGTILETDHFQKINAEARKGKWNIDLKTVIIGLIILAGIYYIVTGDVIG